MKFIFLLLCAALAFTLIINSTQAQQNFDYKLKQFSTNKLCKRKIDVDRNDKTIKFTTKSLCALNSLNSTAIGAFAEMEFVASVERFPLIGMKAKTAIRVSIGKIEKDLPIVVGSAFGIDRIIEYQESNSVEGFQPGNDTIVRSFNLRDQTWKVVDLSKKLVDGSNDSYIYHGLVEANVTGCCTVRMSVVISSSAVQLTSPKMVSRSGIVQVLSPSSLKVSFELANIQYSTQTSLYALGTIVAFRGSRRDKPKSENEPLPPSPNSRQSGSVEKPDDVNDDQEVSTFDNDLSTQLDGNNAILPKPFFSFQKFISQYPTSSPTTVTRGKLIISPFKNVENSLNSDEQFIRDKSEASNAVVSRFWVSLNERVENFVWDPSSGSSDNTAFTTTSDATTSARMTSLLVSFIACLLVILF